MALHGPMVQALLDEDMEGNFLYSHSSPQKVYNKKTAGDYNETPTEKSLYLIISKLQEKFPMGLALHAC